jgi:hypothetical protein
VSSADEQLQEIRPRKGIVTYIGCDSNQISPNIYFSSKTGNPTVTKASQPAAASTEAAAAASFNQLTLQTVFFKNTFTDCVDMFK